MNIKLTSLQTSKALRIGLSAALVWTVLPPMGLSAQDKKVFSRTVDIRSTHSDALLDVFKGISEQFDNELRALGTAYTTAEILYHQQRYDDAARNYMNVINKGGRKYNYLTSSARLRLANSYILRGDFEGALGTAREVATGNNKFLASEAWFLISRAYLALGKTDRAEEAYKNLLTVNPTYGGLLKVDLLSGLLAFEKGTHAEAATHFQKHPDDIPSLYYAIASFCQMKDIAKAVSAYQNLLSKAKQGTWVDRARILIGEAIYQSHDYDLAMTFFGPVSRRDAAPNLRVLALYRLACIDFQKKNYTRSELTLQNLLKEYGEHPLRTDWMYLLATIPVYQRDWTRTIREEGSNVKGRGGSVAPQSIPPEQLVPEAEFRVIWAYMAQGNYGEVVRRTDKFFRKYNKNPLTGYALLLQGVAYDQMNNSDRAIDSYQTLVDLFPQSPAAGKGVYLMTLSLHRAQEPSRIVSALNHLNENLQSNAELKSDSWRKNTLFWIAEGYFSIQDWLHAEQTYTKFVELAPDSTMTPYALQGLAASLAAQGPDKLDKAKVYEQQAIGRAQELGNTALAADAKFQLGKIHFNQKQYDQALGQFDSFVRESTNTVRVAEALYDSGLALYNQQYYSEALARWKQVIDGYRFSPFRSLAYLQTGRTQFGLGKFDQAIAAYQALAANYPNSPEAQEAQFQIIQSYYNKGDVQGAFQQFMAFKSAYPADDRIKGLAEMLLGAYQAQGDSNLHSRQLGELLRASPGSGRATEILWERGASLFNKKDYAAAQKYFQRIMLSYPNDEYAGQAYYYNAECYFFLNNMDEAASAYKSFYINYPADKMVPNAMFQVGVSFFNKKEFQKAAEGFDAFLKKYPQHALAKDASINVALCYKKAFKLDDAIRSYQNYLLLFPNDAKSPFVRLQIGSIHASKGNYQQAIQDFQQIPSGTAERTEGQFRIGEAYQNLHQDAQAQAAFEKLMSMGPRDNEFRIAGLMELAKMMEGKNAAGASLINVYREIATSTKNQDIALMAQQKIKEIQGGH